MKKRVRKISIFCAVALLSLGFAGYWLVEKMGILESMLRAMQLVPLNGDPNKVNAIVAIPWLIAGIVVFISFWSYWNSAIEKIVIYFSNYKRYRDNKILSVCVIGDSDNAEYLRDYYEKKRRPIYMMGDTIPKAHNYVLMYKEDKDSANFFEKHREQFVSDAQVICASKYSRGNTASDTPTYFDAEDAAARAFWLSNFLDVKKGMSEHKYKIVIAGGGRFSERVLYNALLTNLFEPDQEITYVMYGDYGQFKRKHKQLSSIRLANVEYVASRKQNKLMDADAFIYVNHACDIKMVEELQRISEGKPVYVIADNLAELSVNATARGSSASLILFDWRKYVLENDALLDRKDLDDAKRLHAKYKEAHSDQDNWEDMYPIERESNYMALHYQKVRTVLCDVQPGTCVTFSSDKLSELAKIEHERWCTLYYLDNWTNEGIDAKKRKEQKKAKHADLLPFDQLEPDRKENNREFVKLISGWKFEDAPEVKSEEKS